MTVYFEIVSNSETKITMNLVLKSKEEKEQKIQFGAVEGGKQTLNKLAEYLKKMN